MERTSDSAKSFLNQDILVNKADAVNQASISNKDSAATWLSLLVLQLFLAVRMSFEPSQQTLRLFYPLPTRPMKGMAYENLRFWRHWGFKTVGFRSDDCHTLWCKDRCIGRCWCFIFTNPCTTSVVDRQNFRTGQGTIENLNLVDSAIEESGKRRILLTH